ncbi:iron-sulfur cluster assembly scaffold protein [Sinomonas atrocyanea]
MDREELLAVIEQHGATAPGLAPRTPGDGRADTRRVELVNPTCGDRVDLALTLDGGKAVLRGTASGCTLSRAAASLLAAALRSMAPEEAAMLLDVLVPARAAGRPLDLAALPDVDGLGADAGTDARGDGDAEGLPDPCGGPLLALAELAVAPLRRRCILLPWTAARTLLEAGSTPA